MNKVNLGGIEVELYFNVKAMMSIAERCGGDISDIGEWMSGGSTVDTLEKVSQLVTDLANGAVFKHNSEIALGISDGEKKPFLCAEDVMALVDIASISELKSTIFDTIAGGSKFEVPESIKLQEKDEDLEEIEAMEGDEKNE